MIRDFRRSFVACLAFSVLSVAPASFAAPPDEANPPKVRPASDEGEKAIARFRVPDGLKVELFAAEPMLANPVAFAIDEKNRFYVAETFRLHAGVTDTRNHMYWLDDDLASRTIADRVAMYKKYSSPEEFRKYGTEEDRISLLIDRDGDGKADSATVFADGFHDPAMGIGAGVLARGGDVWYTNLPDLWKLKDTDGDGKADEKISLHNGYGVHVGFLGHDLHGLRFGPDGRLYFSIGDRGLNVTQGDRHLFYPDTGTVLRCEPDGSNLEVFASGLRNPQELAFNEFGDLFTVDNNSDGGDRARLVHIVEGGDSGWRIGWQFIESPNSRGPWNSEKLWHPLPENTAYYLLPPLANISDGPSGLTYDPGTGLNDSYRHNFFLCDFRGSSTSSGVRAFTLRPKGASYELAEQKEFVWNLEATDVDFGTDGAVYISDWVEGWNMTGKGRIYRVFDAATQNAPRIVEVKKLLAEGFTQRPTTELAALLNHPDARVRQEAQFTLATRGQEALDAALPLVNGSHPLAKRHAVWLLGQIARKDRNSPLAKKAMDPLTAALQNPDDDLRAQAAKVLGDVRWNPARAVLIAHLGDTYARAAFEAAIALSRMPDRAIYEPLLSVIRDSGIDEPYLRHARVVALASIGDVVDLAALAKDESAAVRMSALLALRRNESAGAADFLKDSDPKIVLEAARAINDVPIAQAMPALASLPLNGSLGTPVLRRILNANIRLGRPTALVAMAESKDLPESIRVEAMQALNDWAKPSGRDRVVGLWRPIEDRDSDPATIALSGALGRLLADSPDALRKEVVRATGTLNIKDAGSALVSMVKDTSREAATRIEALRSLESLRDPKMDEAVTVGLADRDPSVRIAALRVLSKLSPEKAIPALETILQKGTIPERQGAFAILGDVNDPRADVILSQWLDVLDTKKVPPECRLDLLDAAAKRSSEAIKIKLAAIERTRAEGDPQARYRDSLVGGNAERGRVIFREKAEAQCLRCHKIDGNGGEVGPELTGIGKRQPREYILESIVQPDKQIAENFESVVLALADGTILTGVLKSEDEKAVNIMTAEGKLIAVPKADVEERKRGASAMPEDVIKSLTRSEIRDLVEFLSQSKESKAGTGPL
jgi:quinoprotein glucose dehydrogenase